MATIARLNVLLDLEDNAFQRGLANSRQKLDDWGKNLRDIGGKMTLGVTTPVLAGFTKMAMGAADLEQSIGATEQLWGDNADEIIAWANDADKAMGLTQNQALTSVNNFNAMFKQLDAGADVVQDMSQSFTGLSADLSAMWGGSTIEASEALTSALRGNYEGLDKYNINLTEAMVSQEAMNVALADGRDEITEADKLQARYNLILEQTTDAQGQFARETNTTSGRIAILRARIGNLATNIGRLLLPYVNRLADGLSKIVDWLESTDDTTRKWAIGIAAAAAALGPLLIVIGMLLPGLGAFLALIGALLSPIGLLAAGAAALAYVFRDDIMDALDWVIDKFNELRDTFTDFKQYGMDPVQTALAALASVFPTLGPVIAPLRQMLENLGDAFQAIKDGDYVQMFESLGAAARNVGASIWNAIQLINWSAIAAALWNGLQGAAATVISLWQQIDWGGISDGIKRIADEVAGIPFVGWLAAGALDAIALAIDTVRMAWAAGEATWNEINSWLFDVDTNASNASSSLNELGAEAESQTPWWQALGRELIKFGGAAWLIVSGVALILAPFKSLFGTIRGMIGPLGTLLGLLGRIGPIGWIIAGAIGAAALTSAALKNNWLGFRDASEQVWQAFNTIGIAIEMTIGLVRDLLGGWRELRSLIALGFDVAEMMIVDVLNGFISALNDVILDMNTFIAALNILADELGLDLDIPLIDHIKTLGSEADNTALSFNALGKAIANIGASMAGATLGAGLNIQEASKLPFGGNLSETGSTQKGMSGITSMMSGLRDEADRTSQSLTSFASSVGKSMSTAQSSVVSFVSSTIGVMGGWTSGISNQVTSAMSTMQSRTSSGTSSAKNSFVSFVSQVIGVMGGWSTGIVTIVNGAVSQMVSRANSGGQQMTSAFRNGAQNAASAVRSALSAIPGIVASVGGSAASAAFSVGANIGQSMAAGMRSALGAISAAANQMVAEADRAVRARARIASPSKVFADLGEYLGEGFEQGIRSMIPDVARATAALVHTPSMPAYGNYGMPAHAYAGQRGTTITNTYGDIVIHQQPGEDGEALATRIISLLNQAENLAGVN